MTNDRVTLQGLLNAKVSDPCGAGLFKGDPSLRRRGEGGFARGDRRTTRRPFAVGNGDAQAPGPVKVDYVRVRPRRPAHRTRHSRGTPCDSPPSPGRTLP